MTVRDELERCVSLASQYKDEDDAFILVELQEMAQELFLEHGPALLEALADAERINWLQNNPHMVYTSHDDGPIAHFVAVRERVTPRRGNVASTVRQAIDRARGGES